MSSVELFSVGVRAVTNSIRLSRNSARRARRLRTSSFIMAMFISRSPRQSLPAPRSSSLLTPETRMICFA